jgi:hypothetical protein
MFDETFYSAIATTWRHFEVGISLHPQQNTILDPDMFLEHIGDIGTISGSHEDTNVDEAAQPLDAEMPENDEILVAPQIIVKQIVIGLTSLKYGQDVTLVQACAYDASLQIDMPGGDLTIFEPDPVNIRAVLNMKDNWIKEAWLKAY